MKLSATFVKWILLLTFSSLWFASENTTTWVWAQEFQQDTREKFPTGEVNWTTGKVEASGIGVLQMDLPLTAAKAAAHRAAVLVAKRNLLELIKGIKVDSETVVENYLVKSDRIQAKVSGFIKGATIVKTTEHPQEGVEIVLSLPLWGQDSLGVAFLEEESSHTFTQNNLPNRGEYTGVIIDARGLDLKPAMFPKIIGERGKVLYNSTTVSKDVVQKKGYVQYTCETHATLRPISFLENPSPYSWTIKASNLARVGRKPLRIKGIGKQGKLKTNVIISKEDAERIKNNPSLLRALKNANVVIVTDPLIAGIQGKIPNPSMYLAYSYINTPMAN